MSLSRTKVEGNLANGAEQLAEALDNRQDL
jgi:hypothetical protein